MFISAETYLLDDKPEQPRVLALELDAVAGENPGVVAVPLDLGLGEAGHAGREARGHALVHFAVAQLLEEDGSLRLLLLATVTTTNT